MCAVDEDLCKHKKTESQGLCVFVRAEEWYVKPKWDASRVIPVYLYFWLKVMRVIYAKLSFHWGRNSYTTNNITSPRFCLNPQCIGTQKRGNQIPTGQEYLLSQSALFMGLWFNNKCMLILLNMMILLINVLSSLLCSALRTGAQCSESESGSVHTQTGSPDHSIRCTFISR